MFINLKCLGRFRKCINTENISEIDFDMNKIIMNSENEYTIHNADFKSLIEYLESVSKIYV